MKKQLVHPLRLDGHRPLLFLKCFLGRLLGRGGLAHEVLDCVRVECVEHPVEEVAVRVALVLGCAVWLGKVVVELGQRVDHLRVDRLNCQFRPARHVTGRNVLLTKGLLTSREDVLQVLQACRLKRGQQVAD